MWKLTHIAAENLCAFRTLDYTPVQGVTTLVFGDNRDNDTQRSNGSGKSALIEAIAVGITGGPLRKVRGEEIINDAAGECRVRLCLENDATQETLRIERRIPRKGVSAVACTVCRRGAEEPVAQPSVEAYNRYILDRLGLSREELLGTFILSRHRYQDFLSAPDSQKKEIINRFSNALLVDRAMERVAEDIAPIEKTVQEAALEVAGLDGRVEMLAEQIDREEQAAAQKARTREERIAAMQETIAAKRALIRERRSRSDTLGEHAAALGRAEAALQAAEEGEAPLERLLTDIGALFAGIGLQGLTDWDEVLERWRGRLRAHERELLAARAEHGKLEEALAGAARHCDDLKEYYDRLCRENRTTVEGYDRRLQELERAVDDNTSRLEERRREKRALQRRIEELEGQLSGIIRCPACRHEFLLADETFDVEAGREELAQRHKSRQETEAGIAALGLQTERIEREQDSLRADRRTLTAQADTAAGELSRAERLVQEAGERLRRGLQRQRSIENELEGLHTELEQMRRRLFDEAFSLLDDARRGDERELRRSEEEIRAAESAVATLRETIGELQKNASSELIGTLRASLAQYRAKAAEALVRKEEAEGRLHRLQEQQERFVQFKSYLAGTKIEALSRLTNEFLESIGSDIRLCLTGFTMLRTGKIREKISASLLRDGVDCGSFGKFSAGEAARVHLAMILSMQRLANGACEADKGLDLLVVDELLDAMDESGLASTFAALNRMGVTALVVSHGNVAEGYAHKLVIVKEHGESRIG